jgi:hypothetical protein
MHLQACPDSRSGLQEFAPGAALETVFPDRLADQIEWLAYHVLRGEVWEKALPYCRQAGVKAFARSAPREGSNIL